MSSGPAMHHVLAGTVDLVDKFCEAIGTRYCRPEKNYTISAHCLPRLFTVLIEALVPGEFQLFQSRLSRKRTSVLLRGCLVNEGSRRNEMDIRYNATLASRGPGNGQLKPAGPNCLSARA